jgi:hypothetical protein
LILLTDSRLSQTAALATQLAVAQEALSKEKIAQSTVDKALAEEITARQATDQALQSSKEANTNLEQELETMQASLVATHDKLAAKANALDTQVIWQNQAKIQQEKAEEKLRVAEEELKIQ